MILLPSSPLSRRLLFSPPPPLKRHCSDNCSSSTFSLPIHSVSHSSPFSSLESLFSLSLSLSLPPSSRFRSRPRSLVSISSGHPSPHHSLIDLGPSTVLVTSKPPPGPNVTRLRFSTDATALFGLVARRRRRRRRRQSTKGTLSHRVPSPPRQNRSHHHRASTRSHAKEINVQTIRRHRREGDLCTRRRRESIARRASGTIRPRRPTDRPISRSSRDPIDRARARAPPSPHLNPLLPTSSSSYPRAINRIGRGRAMPPVDPSFIFAILV